MPSIQRNLPLYNENTMANEHPDQNQPHNHQRLTPFEGLIQALPQERISFAQRVYRATSISGQSFRLNMSNAGELTRDNIRCLGSLGVMVSGISGILGIFAAQNSEACANSGNSHDESDDGIACNILALSSGVIGALAVPTGIAAATYGYEAVKSLRLYFQQMNDLLRHPLSEDAFQHLSENLQNRPVLTGVEVHNHTLNPLTRERQAADMRNQWCFLPKSEKTYLAGTLCPLTYSSLDHQDPVERIAEPVGIDNQAGVYEYRDLLTAWVYREENPLTRQNFELQQLRQIDEEHIDPDTHQENLV